MTDSRVLLSRLSGVLPLLVFVLVIGLLGACGSGTTTDLDDPRAQPAVPTGTTVVRGDGVTTAPTRAPNRPTPTPTRAADRPAPTPTVLARDGQPAQGNDDRLPAITLAQLPPQARETIRLIELGGPFPYDRDGITFGNRERLLPPQPQGYYREYTVITPGSSDRGARRIVAGREGELYYTDDHYDSFKRVIR